MIKLIAMDLDGTLFDSDHRTISPRNIETIANAHNKGIKIVIASGRTMCQIKNVLRQIPVDYVIASNGAASLDKEGSVIASDTMDYDCWCSVYNILEENNIVTEVYVEGKTYLKSLQKEDYKSDYLSPELLEELKAAINYCDDIPKVLKGKSVEKITSLYVPEDKYTSVQRKFEQMGMEVTSSIPHNMEINKNGVNKGTGLNQLCDMLGIRADEVMTFGDGNNDVEMLLWAENSYAMENAVDEAKKAAKYMTDTNYNDGIAKVVETIL